MDKFIKLTKTVIYIILTISFISVVGEICSHYDAKTFYNFDFICILKIILNIIILVWMWSFTVHFKENIKVMIPIIIGCVSILYAIISAIIIATQHDNAAFYMHTLKNIYHTLFINNIILHLVAFSLIAFAIKKGAVLKYTMLTVAFIPLIIYQLPIRFWSLSNYTYTSISRVFLIFMWAVLLIVVVKVFSIRK